MKPSARIEGQDMPTIDYGELKDILDELDERIRHLEDECREYIDKPRKP